MAGRILAYANEFAAGRPRLSRPARRILVYTRTVDLLHSRPNTNIIYVQKHIHVRTHLLVGLQVFT